MISKQEVEHIAKLARLELTEAEIPKMQKDLSNILDYFDVLKKAPKAKEKPFVVKDIKDTTRKDFVVEKPASLANNLVGSAPDTKDGYFKVKAIL